MRTLAFLLLAAAIAPSAAASDDAKALAVVAASKAASGGSAWDALTGSYEEGERAGGTLPYKTWIDFRRYGMRIESRRGATTVARGFDGRTAWQTGPDGATKISHEVPALADAVLTAYISINGYYFPKRFPAAFNYLREEKAAGRSFDVVEIAPKASRPVEIWFDRATHLVSRIVDEHTSEPTTVEASDYRKVGKVLIPFKLTVTGPDGAVLDKGTVSTVKLRDVDRATFAPAK